MRVLEGFSRVGRRESGYATFPGFFSGVFLASTCLWIGGLPWCIRVGGEGNANPDGGGGPRLSSW